MNDDITYFAETNFRNERQRFGIRQSDRLFHTYIIGKSGVGKSTLMKTKMVDDIKNNRGFALLDVHSDLVSEIATIVKSHAPDRLLYLDFTNWDLPYRYNPLQDVPYQLRSKVVSLLLEVFQLLSGTMGWGVKLEHLLRYALLALADMGNATLADVPRLFTNKEYRKKCITSIVDTEVREFWTHEFPQYSRYDVVPVLNKIGNFLAHPVIRNFVVYNKQDLDFRTLIDSKTCLLVNLSKGQLGTDVARILGALLLTALCHSGLSRSDQQETDRVPFFLYLDEFHNYTTMTVATMLAELRKYKLGLIMANQYFKQLRPEIRDAVLGNVSTLISFRVGYEDAVVLAKEMYPTFSYEDFVRLPNYHIYLKLMIKGKPSNAFSASTSGFILHL